MAFRKKTSFDFKNMQNLLSTAIVQKKHRHILHNKLINLMVTLFSLNPHQIHKRFLNKVFIFKVNES